MTDVIVETQEGKRIHHLIPDNYPAVVYVRQRGTIRVKKADLTPEQEALRAVQSLTGLR